MTDHPSLCSSCRFCLAAWGDTQAFGFHALPLRLYEPTKHGWHQYLTPNRETNSRRTFDVNLVFLLVERKLGASPSRDLLLVRHLLVLARRRLLRPLLHLELGDKEPVHVVHVWVEPPCQAHRRVELLASVALEPRHAELEPGLDELDIRPLAQCVVHDSFVFVDRDGARRVYEVSARLGLGRNAVNGAENQLFLQVGEEGKVALALYNFS
jgi:hypothetical protein